MGRIGASELMIILGIALLIFGPTKLPQLGKAVGQTIGNFKRSSAKAEQEPLTEQEKVEA